MFLYNAILERANANNPVLVCLIGAGKFGAMFLSQVPTTPGLEVVALLIQTLIGQKELACRLGGQPI